MFSVSLLEALQLRCPKQCCQKTGARDDGNHCEGEKKPLSSGTKVVESTHNNPFCRRGSIIGKFSLASGVGLASLTPFLLPFEDAFSGFDVILVLPF